jgi:hypothetical protein
MKKLVLGLIAFLMLASMTFSAHATWTIKDGIDGYVYGNGKPVEGIVVRVYRVSDSSEIPEGYDVSLGYGVGELGKATTNMSGYFHIAWLYAWGSTYKVVAETPVGDIVNYVTVYCGSTTQVNFCYYYYYTIGYWKTHPEAWPVDSLTIGGVPYTQKQLLGILWNAKAKDATSMLAAQLIAAKLNVENGVDPTSISDTISDADEFLTIYPLGSNPRGVDREYALMLKDALDYFNNGYYGY